MAWIIILIIILLIVVRGIKIIPQSKAMVVERLGAYHRTMQTGLHYVIPIFERVANTVSLKEKVQDFAPQPVITKDNVTMQIDTVVYLQITDSKLYTYGVENPVNAIENLTATTLRNIIGELELDETLTSRDVINVKMRAILDEATDPWGIKVNRVEVKNILPPIITNYAFINFHKKTPCRYNNIISTRSLQYFTYIGNYSVLSHVYPDAFIFFSIVSIFCSFLNSG